VPPAFLRLLELTMLDRLLLGAVLAAVPPGSAYPAYLPLPEAAAPAETPSSAPAEDMPSFPIPVPPRAALAPAAEHASATLWLDVIDEDMPSFPIPVPRPVGEETPDR
jgi:hypothetical protein